MSMTKTVERARRSRKATKAASPRSAGHPYVRLLGLQTYETPVLLGRIREGLSFRSWDQFLRNTGLDKDTASHLVNIAPRTLARRKEEGRLHPDESDRLIRVARVFSRAVELFGGDIAAAREWLARPQPALGGSTPLDYAASELGSREVENLIGRLEYGIPT
jgi:putative toxin-antitoxin system antitoxin component (TIGR02293 family)